MRECDCDGASPSCCGGRGVSAAARGAGDGHCCGWLFSLLPWDWLPLGNGLDRGSVNADDRNAAVGGSGRLSGSGELRRRESSSTVSDGEAFGGGSRSSRRGGGGGGAAGGHVDDGKPLLRRSASFEFRQKEKRFVKGQFVLPGSDMQRRIAEAMASMLAAGGRAVSGTTGAPPLGDGKVKGSGNDGYSQVLNDEPTPDGRGTPSQGSTGGTRASRQEHGVSPTKGDRNPPRGQNGGAFFTGSGEETVERHSTTSAAGQLQQDPAERECVICMEDFTKEDPEMLTLCSCGVNKTFFHYSCLLQWLSKHSHCPACRDYLFFEERHLGGRDAPSSTSEIGDATAGVENFSGNVPSGSGGSGGGGGRGRRSASIVSDEDFHRVLRAGLEPISRDATSR